MITLGVDAHKRTHTIVAVDPNGRQLASKTITTTTKDHLGLLTWAEQLAKGNGLLWAIEDCRHLSRRLERDLLAAGQSIVRVPPKLMAHVRDSARTYGKSDPIDALAVARAAQREPDLPTARLDGPDRDVRLLGDHRESLVAERTRAINRLRWYLHELDPSWEPKARSLDRLAILDKVSAHLNPLTGTVVRLARQSIVRVPPKLMAHVRDSARTYGKSDPIDALAVARAAQREPDLPTARLDGPDRDVRLLGDHRESLVAERTRAINRLRWYLHELDPSWEPKARSLDRLAILDKVSAHLNPLTGTVVRLARGLLDRCRALTEQINELTAEITTLVADMAPSLIAIPGCGAITAAKILGETAGVDRFRSKDAYARHNGTAPMPVWSSNRARHRLSRTGNRQLNAALHRIALTQAHWHEPAKQMMKRRKAGGDSGMEALRVLKRRLSDVVYAALRTDLAASVETAAA